MFLFCSVGLGAKGSTANIKLEHVLGPQSASIVQRGAPKTQGLNEIEAYTLSTDPNPQYGSITHTLKGGSRNGIATSPGILVSTHINYIRRIIFTTSIMNSIFTNETCLT